MASDTKSADAFEGALKRELARAPSEPTADCPAQDILAAYYDRSLSQNERARVDSHLLACARCRSMMAAIARADDSEQLLDREPARWIFWGTRLVAPIAVVGIVIAIAIGMRTREHPAPEVIALASPAAEMKPPFAESAAPAVAMPMAPQSAPQAASAPPESNIVARPRNEFASEAPKALRRFRPSDAKSSSIRALSSSAVAMQAQSATGSAFSGAAGAMAKETPMKQITSPDGGVVWRFGAGGTILRAENSSTSLAQRSGVTRDLLAASAPSNDVCWIVGKSGAVVRTLDSGAHWQIVRAPSRDDFTAISASDSNNATLIASDGQRYVTHDGGVTWSSP